ncbi:MAG TPA: dUTP diphosphatase [Hanamia sp.]|jgi:dUTP pyrophosphatase|nr:dUTP diphosphatase [Hanamia sp.]
MQHVEIKILNTSENQIPEYATFGSSGLDLRANLSEPVVLKPMERKMIPTGLFLEIPEGYEVQVRPRSGLAWKHGITCLNSPGTVDSDYRGELKVILINLSDEEHIINKGDRIAQMVLCKVEKANLQPVIKLESTLRGEGGFGHTGHQ